MPKDILLDESFDLLFSNGDLVIGESTRQHQACLMVANKGDYRQYPDRGVGINNYLLDETDFIGLKQSIQKEFELDGMKVNAIDFDGQDIYPDATYKK